MGTKSEPNAFEFFICAHSRSGSTLLRYIVDAHPLICCPSELNLGTLLGELGRVCQLTAEPEAGNLVAGIANGLMDRYRKRKGKPIWFEKTPDAVFQLDLLRAAFPSARYVCLYRNCLDVVQSTLEASRFGFGGIRAEYVRRNPENLVEAMIECWSEITGRILAFESATPGCSLRLRYEDLVTSPEQSLDRLFSFVGVDWDRKTIEHAFTLAHDEGPGDQKIKFASRIYSHLIGKGLPLAQQEISDFARARANSLSEQLGYPRIGEPLPFTPAVPEMPSIHSVDELFRRHMPQRLANRRHDFACSAAFDVTGPGGGRWTVHVDRRNSGILSGISTTAACRITVSAETLLRISNGALTIPEAFFQSLVSVDGDMESARTIARHLFGSMPISDAVLVD
jgi:protein-tyrosine sulfotransferase